MKYLLDTCVISDFIKGQPEVVGHFHRTPQKNLAISSITVMEIVLGLETNLSAKNRIGPALHEFIKQIHVEPFTDECGYLAGHIRTQLKNGGNPIGPFDLLIAASALEKGYILVTSNEREFSRINDLQVVNWRLS